jgi:excisionase family DNA binding protein
MATTKTSARATVAMTIDQAAHDLNTTSLGIKRLVARGRLPATRVGDDWRLLPAHVEKYLAAGAPDLQSPVVGGAGWLADWPRPAGDFETAISDAAQMELEADPAAMARIADARIEPVEYTVPIVGAVLSAAKQELPARLPAVRKLRGQFLTWASFYLSEQLRTFARQQIGRTPFLGTSPTARLYESPTSYRAAVDAAGERMTAQSITRIAWVPVDIDGTKTKKAVKLTLPVASLMTALGLRVDDVAALAF